MRKIWLVVLLAAGGSALASSKTCEYLIAMRGLEASPSFAPLPAPLVRAALDDLRSGGSTAAVLRVLRRASWTSADPLPPALWWIGKFRADFYVKNERPRLRLRFPRILIRTPIAIATGLHEHLHARIYAFLPGLSEHEAALKERLVTEAEKPEALLVAEELGELHYQQERLALIAESAVYTVLDDQEQRNLLRRLDALPRDWLAGADREIFATAVRSGGVAVEEYLRRQYAIGRYSRAACHDGFREDVQAYRQLAQDDRDAKEASAE